LNAPVISIDLSPEAKAIVKRFETLPARFLQRSVAVLNQQLHLTSAHIQEQKLSERGPKTLGVVTNRLRSSVRVVPASIQGNIVEGAIGTNVRYAGVHEFGYSGPVTVKQHVRQTAERFAIDNGRTTVSRSVAGRLGLLTKKGTPRKGAAESRAGKQVTVKEHTRQVNFPERAMFRTGISERMPAIVQALSDAIVKEAARG
jgi:hypothetical protein